LRRCPRRCLRTWLWRRERAEIRVPSRSPAPQLSWTRDGHLDPDAEADRVQLREDGTLSIKEVLQTDEGSMSATPPTRQAKSSPSAILDVIGVAPFWVKSPRDVVGVAGAKAELSCRVGGDPPQTSLGGGGAPGGGGARGRGSGGGRPTPVDVCCTELPVPLVYWTREGSQTILPAARVPMDAGVGGRRLEGVKLTYSVTRAAHHHSGRYVCGGVNSAGGVMTRVGVRVRPAHLLPPPIISVAPTNQTLPLRGHAAMTCRVWGSPPPTVTWRHNGRLVTSTSRRTLLPDTTLTIDELTVDDGGQYACVASSSRGVTEARATLTVASAADPDVVHGATAPATPTVRASNGTAAVVEWAAPGRQGASPVTGYTLEYYSSTGAAWKVATAHTPHTSFTLAPLDAANTYGVTVRAHNAHGVSEPSGIAEVGVGGGWVRAEEGNIGLQEAKVVLQDAVPTGQASAKILWQAGRGS
ncbi:Roundabout 1-like 1, partial [Homarus americanus]